MSLLDRIRDFEPSPGYCTKYEDPAYIALVRQQTRTDRHKDQNLAMDQDRRDGVRGLLQTGGRGGLMSGPALPDEECREGAE